MKPMTHEEIKAMVGTEFIYVYNDYDAIHAIVAAYDPKIGFTCLATSLITKDGHKIPSSKLDYNGNYCLIGIPISHPDFRTAPSTTLRIIKHLRCYPAKSKYGYTDGVTYGRTRCSFN